MQQKPYEIPAEMRDLAEKSVTQAKKAFDGFIGAANKAVDAVTSQTSTAQSSATGLAKKAMDYAGNNVTAAFDLAQKLVQAKDVQEVVRLQTAYLTEQMAALQTQMKDLTTDAVKTASEAAKPKA